MDTSQFSPDVLITEEQFSRAVEDLLTTCHWRWTHFRPARTDKGYRTALSGDKGFPDYVAVRDGHVLFIELKSAKGRTTDDQEAWWRALLDCGNHVHYHLWRPKDWDIIVQTLR